MISQQGSYEREVISRRYADNETKLLRHYGTKVVSGIKDVREIRRKGDKFETEKVVLIDSSNEHESIVGWGCYPNNETGKFLVSETRQEFSLRGRELERGVGQNNNYFMPIFEVGTNVVTEGYVRSTTPLSHIRNTRYTLVNDCDLSLGEVVSSIKSYLVFTV